MTSPGLVELARVAAGLTQGALAKKLGKTQPFISQVERGERDIPVDLVASWAAACGVPPSYFTRTSEPLSDSFAGMVHRRLRTLPTKPFSYANAQVKLICLELDSLLSEVDIEPALEIPTLPEGVGPADAAAAVRRAWRVPSGPLPDLMALVESAGIPVVLLDSFHEKHSATSHRGRWFEWVIVLNANHPPSRRRMTLAHELGHVVLRHDQQVLVGEPDEADREARQLEAEADAFASALLMPEEDAVRELRSINFRRLVALKTRWRVSIAFLIMRAYKLELITDHQRQLLYMELSSLPGGRRREPAEFEAEEPRLAQRVVHALENDGLTLEEIADLATMDEDLLRHRYLGEPHRHLRAVETRTPRTRLQLRPPQ